MEGFMDVFELGTIKSANIRRFFCKLADFFCHDAVIYLPLTTDLENCLHLCNVHIH